MIRVILDGRKTLTRRAIKNILLSDSWPAAQQVKDFINCPYGYKRDQLWVRETWAYGCGLDSHENCDRGCIKYKADEEYENEFGLKWKSPRFMPRWASRITLKIINVTAERLKNITEEDAKKEGFEIGHGLDESSPFFAKGAFKKYWDILYHKKPEYQWLSNPWVWVIEFKRL